MDSKTTRTVWKNGFRGHEGNSKGVIDSIGAIAEGSLKLADNVVKKGIKASSPGVKKLSSMSARMLQKKESPDNVNPETCGYYGNNIFCHFSKNYKYGNKHQAKENGILKDIFVGETHDKIMEVGINDAKHIAATLQEHMSNDDTGEFSLERAKQVLTTNISPSNLRRILKLMNMLELMFPEANGVNARFGR